MSASSSPTARASATTLPDFVDQQILVIGKLDSQQGSEATFTLTDGTITVHIGTALAPPELGAVYQVLGKVLDDRSLKALHLTNLRTTDLPPTDFMERVQKLQAAPALRAVFQPETE